MNSVGRGPFYGIKRFSRFGAVISWFFLLSVLFVTHAFGGVSSADGDGGDAFMSLNLGDEDPGISESSSSPGALGLLEDNCLNKSIPFDWMGLDDQGDQVKFIFDWGDGTTSETDFVDSGTNVSLSHNWSSEGVYLVRVRAEDVHGASSDWSEALEVAIISKIIRVSSSIRSAGL